MCCFKVFLNFLLKNFLFFGIGDPLTDPKNDPQMVLKWSSNDPELTKWVLSYYDYIL